MCLSLCRATQHLVALIMSRPHTHTHAHVRIGGFIRTDLNGQTLRTKASATVSILSSNL